MVGQSDQLARFAVIEYVRDRQFVFYARQSNYGASSYICQLQQGLFKYEYVLNIQYNSVLLQLQHLLYDKHILLS